MKTLQNWFDEYAVSHQNKLNKKIHYICVPIIYFTIVGLLFAIPFGLYQTGFPLLDNWAILILFLIILFYIFLRGHWRIDYTYNLYQTIDCF